MPSYSVASKAFGQFHFKSLGVTHKNLITSKTHSPLWSHHTTCSVNRP